MPHPLSIYTKKAVTSAPNHSIPWWLKGLNCPSIPNTTDSFDHHKLKDTEPRPKGKRPADRWFLYRPAPGKPWIRYAPAMGVHLRNRTPDETEAIEAALFSTEEIAEQTHFVTVIDFPDLATAEAFFNDFGPVLNGLSWLTIGRGGCPVKVAQGVWLSKRSPSDHSPTTSFVLALESDLIARGPNLGFFNGLSPEVLAHLLDVDLAEGAPSSKYFGDALAVHGFNAASRLTRSPCLAVRRGSTLRVDGANAPLLASVLKKRMAEGRWLGDRTWEGFGRFRLDFDPLTENQKVIPVESSDDGALSLESLIGRDEEVLEDSRKLAQKIWNSKEKCPSLSQWQDFLYQVASASSVSDILNEILPKRRETLGGLAWNQEIAKGLESALNSRDIESARRYLSWLVQWLRPHLKERDNHHDGA